MKIKEIRMIDGSIPRHMLAFSVPLIFSNLLQVLFNMSDVAVVGRFAGSHALGAVGSTATFLLMFMGLVMGMGMGVNALTARALGANDTDAVRKTVFTSAVVVPLYGVLIFALAFAFTPAILTLLGTKEELFADAVLYARVFFIGLPGLAVYNFGNGVFSAAGDTKRPLMFLTVSGAVNVLLNLFFVIVCNLGVFGVALASMISQYLSAALILIALFREKSGIALSLKHPSFSLSDAKTILALGIPAGVQHALFSFANLFVQAGVNSFDTVMVEGNSAAMNADSVVYNVMDAFYIAAASFIGQNFGAGNRERVRKSYVWGIVYSFSSAAVLGGMLILFGRPFLSIFTPDASVVDAGLKRLIIMSLSYCVSSFMDCSIASSRALGKTVVPTVAVILGSCLFRIAWIYTVFAYFHTFESLYLLYIFSWTLTSAFEVPYFILTYRKIFSKGRIGSVDLEKAVPFGSDFGMS